jgi:exodeoxyribonuclease VII large subunit
MLDVQEQRLQNLQQRSVRALGVKTRSEALRWAALSRSLTAAHPQHILQRGFAWLEDSQGGAVTSVQGLNPGQSIWAVLADGRARASVEEVAGRVAGSPESPLGSD